MPNMNDTRKEVLFSDLGNQLSPADAITDGDTPTTWRRCHYETAELSGTLVAAQDRSRVAPLTLSPNLTGWYRIHLGIGRRSSEGHIQQRLLVSLTGDKAERLVAPWRGLSPWTVDDCFFRCADMTGKSLTFRHPEYERAADETLLAFVRFIPMSDEEVSAYLAERERRDTRTLYATDDVHNVLTAGPKDLSIALAQIENLRESDVGVLAMEYWGFAKFYTGEGVPEEIFWGRDYEECAARTMRRFRAAGIDPYKEMIAHARDVGLSVHLSMRIGAWNYEFPWDAGFATLDYDRHPELHMRDRDGVAVSRLSLAFRETWEIYANYYSEMAKYDIDGVDLLFNRGYPFILFEEPFLSAFREKYGVDARTLPNADERVMREKCRFITAFLRHIRARLDSERAARGQKPLRYTAHVHKTLEGCRLVGLDVESWAKEGLIDTVVCYPLETYESYPDHFYADEEKTVLNLDAYLEGMRTGPDRFRFGWYDAGFNYTSLRYDVAEDLEAEVQALMAAVAGTSTKLFVHVMPRNQYPSLTLERARKLYAFGADGIALWDTNTRTEVLREWTTTSRLGHREEIETMDHGEGVLFKNHNFTVLGNLRMDRYPPHWGA